MDTLLINEIEEGKTRNIEIVVAGVRRITLSISKKRTSIEMPHSDVSFRQGEGSFYAVKDWNERI